MIMDSLRKGNAKPYVPLGKVNVGLALVSAGLGAKNQWDQDRLNPDINSNQRFVRTVIQGAVPSGIGFGGAALGASSFTAACAVPVVTVEFAPFCGLFGGVLGGIAGSFAGDKLANYLSSNLENSRFKPISKSRIFDQVNPGPGNTFGVK